MKRYRIGFVGTGGIAHSHISGYRAILGDKIEIIAGCDPDKERLNTFCDKYGIRHRFTTAESLLNSGEVDIIVMLTPPSVRAEYIFPALEKGIHVLVEKPFGNSVRECIEYVKTAEKYSATLAVSQNMRFYPDIEWAKSVVFDGKLGELTYIAHDHFQWRMQTHGWRATEKRLEISIFSVHILDRLRWIAGVQPDAVSCVTRKSWLDDSPVGEVFSDMTIQFIGGTIGHITSSWYSTIPECRMRIDGKQGTLVIHRQSATSDNAEGTLSIQGLEPEKRIFSIQNISTLVFGHSMRNLVEAIDAGREPVHSGKDNLQTMAIIDAAYLSAERGGTLVKIAEVM